MPPVWRYPANTGGLRRIGSIRRCYNVVFLAGCAVSAATAAWRSSRPWRKRMADIRIVSVKLGSVRTPEGIPLPSNAVAALRRQMERFRVIKEQIKAIELTRLQRLQRDP